MAAEQQTADRVRAGIVTAWDTAERIHYRARERRVTIVAGQSVEGDLRLGAADDEQQWLQSGDIVDLGGWA
jgi:hypothetical protein